MESQATSNPSILLQYACYASQYQNMICDPGCNNLECGYDGGDATGYGSDCTQSQILNYCDSETAALSYTQAQRSTSYAEPPLPPQDENTTTYSVSTLVPVNFQLSMDEKLRLLLDGEFNEIVMLQACCFACGTRTPCHNHCQGASQGAPSSVPEQRTRAANKRRP